MTAASVYAIAHRLQLSVPDVMHTSPGVILDTMTLLNPRKADPMDDGRDE